MSITCYRNREQYYTRFTLDAPSELAVTGDSDGLPTYLIHLSSMDAIEYQSFTTQRRMLVATIVLYCYDWLLTLGQEVKYVWQPRRNILWWIFVIVRYATLLNMVLHLVPTPTLHLSMGLRTYALCGRRVWVLLIVSGLAGVPLVTDLIGFIMGTIVFIPQSPFDVCERAFYQVFSNAQLNQYCRLSRVSQSLLPIL
ncbi:hypothetical protein BC629DRAFT_1104269 [Irpex lacteus]|nr:hypothetical protein BC629DRAFT_1104269 [Irpex lacteus]